MAYTKTTWVNDTTPAINATNLNNMEDGIADAHDKKPYVVKYSQATGTQTLNSTTTIVVNLDSEVYSDANYSLASDIVTLSAAGTYLVIFQVTTNTSGNVATQRLGWAAWVEYEPSGGGGYTRIDQLYAARYWREAADMTTCNGTGIYVATAGDKLRLCCAHTAAASAAWELQQNLSSLSCLLLEP